MKKYVITIFMILLVIFVLPSESFADDLQCDENPETSWCRGPSEPEYCEIEDRSARGYCPEDLGQHQAEVDQFDDVELAEPQTIEREELVEPAEVVGMEKPLEELPNTGLTTLQYFLVGLVLIGLGFGLLRTRT